MRRSPAAVTRRIRLQELPQVRQLYRISLFRQQSSSASYKSLSLNQSTIRHSSTSKAAAAVAGSTSGAAAAKTASTAQAATAEAGSIVIRFKNLLLGTTVGLFFWLGYLYVTDVRAGIHQWAVAPSLRWIYDDAEEAHEAGTESLKALYAWGLHPRERGDLDKSGDLSVEVSDGANSPAQGSVTDKG